MTEYISVSYYGNIVEEMIMFVNLLKEIEMNIDTIFIFI